MAPTITVTVNVGAAAIPQVINPARVSTPNDVNPSNDTDEEPTPVSGPDDPKLLSLLPPEEDGTQPPASTVPLELLLGARLG